MMAKKCTLNWDTFSEHLQLMFKDLYQEGRHTDVTLVSDDQTQFKAHKIVLSACSPVFKKIIDSNPSQHPLIYLREDSREPKYQMIQSLLSVQNVERCLVEKIIC